MFIWTRPANTGNVYAVTTAQKTAPLGLSGQDYDFPLQLRNTSEWS